MDNVFIERLWRLAEIRMRLSPCFREGKRSQGRHRFLDQLLQRVTASFGPEW
jgi:hypothetical protein